MPVPRGMALTQAAPDDVERRHGAHADVARALPEQQVVRPVAGVELEVLVRHGLVERIEQERGLVLDSRCPAVGSKIVSASAVTSERRKAWSSEPTGTSNAAASSTAPMHRRRRCGSSPKSESANAALFGTRALGRGRP